MTVPLDMGGGGPAVQRPKLSRRELVVVLLQAAGRLLAGLVVIVFMLRLVPEQPDPSIAAPLLLAAGATALYAWFFLHQLRGVYKAKYPTVRAAEALILVAAMFLAVFTVAYVMISASDPAAFTEELTPFSGYYYALTVLATVGFGDIAPATVPARAVTMVQMALDIAFIAVLFKVIAGAARRALADRTRPPEHT